MLKPRFMLIFIVFIHIWPHLGKGPKIKKRESMVFDQTLLTTPFPYP